MKKFKLISTIASLCLAVALMAFGVYAAKNINVSVESSISFNTENNVKGKLTVKSYNIKNYTVNETNPTAPTIASNETVFEEFIANVNNAGGSATKQQGDGKKEKVEITTDKLFVVYEISFESTTNNKPTLKVASEGENALSIVTTVNEQETVVESKYAKCVYNGLSTAQASYQDGAAQKYYIVIKITDDAVKSNFDYKVKFTVNIAATIANT